MEKIKFSYKYYCVPEEEFIKGILNFRDDSYDIPDPFLIPDSNLPTDNAMIHKTEHYLDLEDEGEKKSIKVFSLELLQNYNLSQDKES